mmetsp:Transcript_134520/g.429662  ORF Transcript_134520/g.429662 Transcript_134520/m.429662 type:complete len:240 (-) Transcript_134520:889-1608(-)
MVALALHHVGEISKCRQGFEQLLQEGGVLRLVGVCEAPMCPCCRGVVLGRSGGMRLGGTLLGGVAGVVLGRGGGMRVGGILLGCVRGVFLARGGGMHRSGMLRGCVQGVVLARGGGMRRGVMLQVGVGAVRSGRGGRAMDLGSEEEAVVLGQCGSAKVQPRRRAKVAVLGVTDPRRLTRGLHERVGAQDDLGAGGKHCEEPLQGGREDHHAHELPGQVFAAGLGRQGGASIGALLRCLR